MRASALLLAISATTLFAQDSSRDPGSFEIEPPLLIPNRSNESLPGPEEKSPADVDLAKLEKQFDRARRAAATAERLCKIGALSKVEAEQRILRAVRLESDLANAQLAQAKTEMLARQHDSSDGSGAATSLALAIEHAHAASARREQAEIDAAEANVHRQEKLLALGSARKSDVQRALQKFAELKAARN